MRVSITGTALTKIPLAGANSGREVMVIDSLVLDVQTVPGRAMHSTLGSYEPFYLPFGNIIFNRTSGSIAPNITTTGTNSIITIISIPQDNATKIAIGAGVGVPLTIALVIVSVMLRQQIALRKALERNFRQTTSSPNQNQYPLRSELYSGPTTQVRPINEAGGLSVYELHGSNR
ncbi:unnamed protein product [Sphagnum balticum]